MLNAVPLPTLLVLLLVVLTLCECDPLVDVSLTDPMGYAVEPSPCDTEVEYADTLCECDPAEAVPLGAL